MAVSVPALTAIKTLQRREHAKYDLHVWIFDERNTNTGQYTHSDSILAKVL